MDLITYAILKNNSGNSDVSLTKQETLVMLAEADIIELATDKNGDIFTDANGNIIVF